MRGFGLKAAAIRVLNQEFMLGRTELKEELLDRCVNAGGNQYDMALQYIIAQSTGADRCELGVARKLCSMATNPEAMIRRVDALTG